MFGNVRTIKALFVGILFFFAGTCIISDVHATSVGADSQDVHRDIHRMFSPIALYVWVDDDYYDGGSNDGHTWGYDAFDTIQDGIDHVDDGGTVHVNEGIYDVVIIEGRQNIAVIGEDGPIVTGNQLAYDRSYPAFVNNVVFVNNSFNITFEGFHMIGTDPAPENRDFTVFFQSSAGAMKGCTIDANSIENMNGIAVRAILGSSVTISGCTIKDYGRIAVYAKTGTTLNVLNSTLIGQVYNVDTWVNYGVEIEGIDDPCEGTIKGNEIYHHDNTQTTVWSSGGIIVDYWRYYGTEYNCMNSTVRIENNEIYDNLHGVQIVPNQNIVMTYNELHGNNYGAISEPWYDGSYHDVELNALNNWWGDPTGPYHPTENPDGLGDEIYGDVLFNPWTADISADIFCDGELNWEDVPAGEVVEGSFVVENTGYIYSELSWEVAEKPAWGVWTITPESGAGLTSDMGQITVHVSIVAPQKKNKVFTGTLKVINSDDPSEYCEIEIYLKTPRTTTFIDNSLPNGWLFERLSHILPILRQLLGYSVSLLQ